MEKKFQSLQTAAGHYKCRICCNNLKNCKKCEKRVDIPWYRQYTNEVGCGKRIRRIWGLSSAGRASALQAEGHRFEPCRPHTMKDGGIAQLARAHGSYPWCRWFKSSSRYFCANVCGTSCLWQVCCISIYRNTARESEVSGSFLLFNFIYRSIQEKQNRL